MSEIPVGFEPVFRLSEFTELIGPLYARRDAEAVCMGMRFQKKHGNSRGKAHGGMISTLADLAMGYSLAFSETPPRPFLTVSMNVDFLGHIEIGDWVEVTVTIDRKGESMAFARCDFKVDERIVARAAGVFKTTRADFQTDLGSEP